MVVLNSIRRKEMQKKITFRDTPHSDVAENYANEQLAKVEEFLKNEAHTHLY